MCLTHLPLMPHICVSDLSSIGLDNGFSPVRRPAITWTNSDSLSVRPLGRNFSEIRFKIQNSLFMKMHLNISAANMWPFCQGGHFSTQATLCPCHLGLQNLLIRPRCSLFAMRVCLSVQISTFNKIRKFCTVPITMDIKIPTALTY